MTKIISSFNLIMKAVMDTNLTVSFVFRI